MLRLAMAALLLIVLTPSATACTIGEPMDFSRIPWADDNSVFTNHGRAYGFYSLTWSNFEEAVEPFPMTPPALSPDGQWLAWQDAEGLLGDCTAKGGVVHVRTPDGDTERVLERSARALSVGPQHLAVALQDEPEIRIYALGEWDDVREVRIAHEYVPRMAMSPDGRWLVASLRLADQFVIVDVERAKVAHTFNETDDLTGIAFSPDADRVAILTGAYESYARLRILDPATGETLEEHRREGDLTPLGLAWGEPGIAYAARDNPRRGHGVMLNDVTVHLLDATDLTERATRTFEESESAGGMVFLPDGRLALGMDGQLFLLKGRNLELAKVLDQGIPAVPGLIGALIAALGGVILGPRKRPAV